MPFGLSSVGLPNLHNSPHVNQLLPESRHLITCGQITVSYPPDTGINMLSINYKELNPKMDGVYKSETFNYGCPILARNLLENFPDMIFLDSEVDPQALSQLIDVEVPATDEKTYTLRSRYNIANDPYRGACLESNILNPVATIIDPTFNFICSSF